jgi:hypothetical protein
MVPDGLLLVANFSPRCDSLGEGLHRVDNTSHVHVGHEAGPMYLMEADGLDMEMLRHELIPVSASETVSKQTEKGQRVTVNALYRKRRS